MLLQAASTPTPGYDPPYTHPRGFVTPDPTPLRIGMFFIPLYTAHKYTGKSAVYVCHKLNNLFYSVFYS